MRNWKKRCSFLVKYGIFTQSSCKIGTPCHSKHLGNLSKNLNWSIKFIILTGREITGRREGRRVTAACTTINGTYKFPLFNNWKSKNMKQNQECQSFFTARLSSESKVIVNGQCLIQNKVLTMNLYGLLKKIPFQD